MAGSDGGAGLRVADAPGRGLYHPNRKQMAPQSAATRTYNPDVADKGPGRTIARGASRSVVIALTILAACPPAWAASAGAIEPRAPEPRTLSGAASATQAPAAGDRSRELLDYRCANQLGVRQITLFANGTVRLREGLGKAPRMRLGELGPVELEGYVARLLAEDLSEVHDRQESAEGDWLEHCTLRLGLDGRPARDLAFSRFDSLPLSVATILRVADEMAARTRVTTDLPPRYRARPGDVLRRADGILFEVVGFTADKLGLEMRGVEQPLTLYIRPEDIPAVFEALVSRRRP